MSTYDLRLGVERFRTTGEGRDTWHCFSFGAHYDPANVSFGALVACNDERLQPGSGYPTHLHRDVDIVTWVVEGELTHSDSLGRAGVLRPGSVQLVGAGSGVEHSERNDGQVPVRFVQMWLRPEAPGTEPRYALRDVTEVLGGGSLTPVLELTRAVLHAGRLPAGSTAVLPAAPYLHLYVARGRIDLDGVAELAEGDALRITDGEGDRLTVADTAVEVLIWAMSPSRGSRGGGSG